ncbi:pectinacetylesterase family protein [Patescibacteria group bacterium]|nr:pectinacetylesterase family protein [Patescibacteria group bacterium]
MKKILLIILIPVLLFSACKKDKDKENVVDSQFDSKIQDENVDDSEYFDSLDLNADERAFLKKYEIVDAEERQAVCNDGSPAVYYYRPGMEGYEDKWVVHLKGGGSCFDEQSCTERWKTQRSLMSSKNYNNYMKGAGIMSADSSVNPDFYAFNHVYVPYCTSDVHSGDAEITYGDKTMQMRGANVVEAIFEDLPFEEASEILLTGSSAGGAGVVRNLDRVADWFPNVQVKGVVDSSWFPFVMEPYAEVEENARKTALTEEEFLAFNLFIDETCRESEDFNLVGCGVDTLTKYVETPFFVYVDQNDQNHLTKDLGISDPNDPEQLAVIDEFAANVREAAEGLDAVFCPRVGGHTAVAGLRFNSVEIDGHSFQEVLGNWYFDRGVPIKVIEGD